MRWTIKLLSLRFGLSDLREGWFVCHTLMEERNLLTLILPICSFKAKSTEKFQNKKEMDSVRDRLKQAQTSSPVGLKLPSFLQKVLIAKLMFLTSQCKQQGVLLVGC